MISGLVLVFIWAGEKEGGVVSLFGEKALCFCFGDFFFGLFHKSELQNGLQNQQGVFKSSPAVRSK